VLSAACPPADKDTPVRGTECGRAYLGHAGWDSPRLTNSRLQHVGAGEVPQSVRTTWLSRLLSLGVPAADTTGARRGRVGVVAGVAQGAGPARRLIVSVHMHGAARRQGAEMAVGVPNRNANANGATCRNGMDCRLEYAGRLPETDVRHGPRACLTRVAGVGSGWRNRLVFGDNLTVLRSLLDERAIAG